MITYKDITFCENWGGCLAGGNCSRAITEDVLVRAEEMGLPLSVTTQFDCFVPKEKDDQDGNEKN